MPSFSLPSLPMDNEIGRLISYGFLTFCISLINTGIHQ